MSFFSKVKTNNEVWKNYSYEKNKINLNFRLRTDIKHQMKDFLELIKSAQKEIEEDLTKL